MLGDETIKNFLEAVAAKPSTPAGGSVAALSAAAAAALAEMTANLSLGKPGYEEMYVELKDMAKLCSDYRTNFIADMDRDSTAFEKVLAVYKLPEGSEEECEKKRKEIQESYKGAVLIPVEMAKNALKMMVVIKSVFKIGYGKNMTDAAQAYLLAETAVRSLLYHIEANLVWIDDKSFTDEIGSIVREFKSGLDCPLN